MNQEEDDGEIEEIELIDEIEEEEAGDSEEEEEDDEADEDADEFEDQGSESEDSDDEDADGSDESEEEEDEGVMPLRLTGVARSDKLKAMEKDGSLAKLKLTHMDDLSDDDEDGDINTIGNVPMRWYDEEKHIGYDRTGNKIARSAKGNGIDAALAAQDDPNWRYCDLYIGFVVV